MGGRRDSDEMSGERFVFKPLGTCIKKPMKLYPYTKFFLFSEIYPLKRTIHHGIQKPPAVAYNRFCRPATRPLIVFYHSINRIGGKCTGPQQINSSISLGIKMLRKKTKFIRFHSKSPHLLP